MDDYKFYTLFAVCTPAEFTGFYKYLRQMHYRKTETIRIFEYVRKVCKAPDAKDKLDPAVCYQNVFGEKEGFDRKKVSNIYSDLHLMLKQYLLFEKIKSDNLESQTLWLAILNRKGLEFEFYKQVSLYIEEFENKPQKDLSDLLNHMVLQYHYYYNFKTASAQEGLNRIQKNAQALETFITAIELRMQCEALYLKRFMLQEPEDGALFQQLSLPQTEFSPDHPLPFLYNELKKLLESENFQSFDTFADSLIKNEARIGDIEMNSLQLFVNGIFTAINRTKLTVEEAATAHRVNKILFEKGLFTRLGEMPVGHFLNVVLSASRVGDFSWIARFLNACKVQLPDSERTNAVNMAKVIVAIEKKEYEKALSLLKTIESKDLYIQIRVKIYPIICHYELDVPGADVYDLCNKTESYLKNHQEPLTGAVQSAINFISIVKMLLVQKTDKQKIIESINTTKLLNLRHWLLEKAAKYPG